MAETPTTRDRRPKTVEARERMRDGQYKGLLRAVRKRKADNSANYATNFNHGQTASDFERSAEAAGETREEVRGHLALLDRTLLKLCGWFQRAAALPSLPLQTGAASPRPPKLVRALALLFWRPLRLLRTQQNWEQLAICYRLQQVRDWRRKHPELTVEQVEKLHQGLYAVLENYLFYLEPRLERIEKRFGKVWRLYRALVGVVGAVFGARDSGLDSRDSVSGFRGSGEETRDPDLGTELRDSGLRIWHSGAQAGDGSAIANQKSQIKNRESSRANHQSPIANYEHQDSCANLRSPNTENRTPNPETRVRDPEPRTLLQFRGTPHYEQFHPTWDKRIDDLSPEEIADCFQSPSHARKAQQRRAQPAAVKDPKDWQEHPPKPRPPESEFTEFAPSELIRTPSERELRRLVRKGELTVPGSFEEFRALVEEALGLPIQGEQAEGQSPITDHQSKIANSKSSIDHRQSTIALAESLWNRMHVFSSKIAEFRELLEATLVWDPNRFLRLWLKLLPVEQAYDAVGFFNHTHGPHHADVAWGEDEPPNPRKRTPLRPYITPRTEAEGRQKHAGELQPALRLWLWAVEHALVPAMRASHQVTVALYDWAVSGFGIREEFLQWRPNLSLAQLETRQGRPEWAVRVTTVTGKTLVKLRDGRVFEPG